MAKSKTKIGSSARASGRSLTSSASAKAFGSASSSYLRALPRDFREFLHSLTAQRVKFLLIGGHAVALHGAPRATFDIDIFVGRAPRNIERLGRALVDFGFPQNSEAVTYLASGERFIMLGAKPLRIDILNHISGVSFEEAWSSRRSVKDGEVVLSIIGLRALIKNKRASARPKDLADVALLTR